MKIIELTSESLKPSQYRQYVKGWNKSKWDDIFQGKYRIYLPLLETDHSEVKPNIAVKNALEKVGMKITDYVNGYAVKHSETNSRIYRIGRILSNPKFDFDPWIKKQFDNDPKRVNSKNSLVVISRHPYDIAGMSTNRGWSSCLNLNQEQSNSHYIPLEIKHGTCVAYLIHSTDKDIKNPIARVAIKPFVNIVESNDIAFGVDEVVYGTANQSFIQTVINWADNVNKSRKLQGVFNISPHVYNTTRMSSKIIGIDDIELKRQLEKVTADGLSIQDIDDPSELVQLAAVKDNGYAIGFIKDPSEKVQMAALGAEDSTNDIDNSLNKFLIWSKSGVFDRIKNPTPKVISYAKSKGII
jgi:hypothetical protein